MKKELKILLAVVVLIIVYVIGMWFPLEILKPNYKDELINKSEYYRLLISIISAFITFSAVIVALFKDDIREYWKYSKIDFNSPANITIEDRNDDGDSQSDDLIQVRRFLSRIEVQNSGNLPTMNAEIYLDKLEFIPNDSTIPQYVETTGTPIKWNGANSETIIIPPGGKKLINVVEVIAPEKISLPDSAKESKPAKLIIGNIENKLGDNKGKWNATFTLYAQNVKATSFVINIEWNGIWKNRLTEMSNYFKIEKKG